MSKVSQEFRDDAAKQMRASRKSSSTADKVGHAARAASLKQLAHNEEWLGGERERSAKRTPKNEC